jgi:ubiquinone/menaquinone biosynthesis C-methylase UbiE
MRLLFWRKSSTQTGELPAQPRRWVWLSGRRVLTDTPYVLPKDVQEADRLDLQHHLLKIAAGGNYRAPIRFPRAILDVACGTGTWGREMALEFPKAQVIGFDIDRTPIGRAMEILGPGSHFPANFQFQMADALKPFPFENESFDFVHGRMMSPFLPMAQWPHVVGEMFRVTKRGGCIELADMERTPFSDSDAYHSIEQAVSNLMEKRGLYIGVGDQLANQLQLAGAKRVQQRKFLLGSGRQQRLLAADVMAIQGHMKPILVKLGYFTEEQFDKVHQQAKDDTARLGINMPVVFAFGQKL